MSRSTLPYPAVNQAPGAQSPTDGVGLRTDEGLRHVLRAVQTSGSWDASAGRRLLAEVRRRAVRNAAHVATATGTVLDRGLVDYVLLAAWLVLCRHGDKVAAAARPWAYVMSSAQRQVLDEVQAQRLLANDASIRGRTREVLPGVVRPVGASANDPARALRHEHPRPEANNTAGDVLRQVRNTCHNDAVRPHIMPMRGPLPPKYRHVDNPRVQFDLRLWPRGLCLEFWLSLQTGRKAYFVSLLLVQIDKMPAEGAAG